MLKIILIFFVWFIIINVFAFVAQNRFNLTVDTAYPWISQVLVGEKKEDLLALHEAWDSYWYLDIAQNGYLLKEPGKLSNVVFFPLYPLLIKTTTPLFLNNPVLSGWFLSSFFLLLSLIYLYKLVKKYHPQINPFLPVVFLLVFPSAYFFNAVYTESLFLFLSLAAFYYILERRFFAAGIFGLLATLTRSTGVFLFLPFIWEYFMLSEFKITAFIKKDLIPMLLIPLGLFAFFLYHFFSFGNFWLFFETQKNWGRSLSFNFNITPLESSAAVTNFSLDLFLTGLVLVMTIFIFKKLRFSYGLYILISLFFILGSGSLTSINRYILVLFPIYIFTASIKNDYFRGAWLLASTLLLALNIILFTNNYWAG